jgi:hypothetical protein
MKKNLKKRKLRTKFPKIQSCDSIFCGFFCLSFLLASHKKIPLTLFFNQFKNKNMKKNDDIVVNFIQEHI